MVSAVSEKLAPPPSQLPGAVSSSAVMPTLLNDAARFGKVTAGELDAVVLATAGLVTHTRVLRDPGRPGDPSGEPWLSFVRDVRAKDNRRSVSGGVPCAAPQRLGKFV